MTARVRILTLISLGLSACAGGSAIVSSADPAADFSEYETFAYMSTLGTDRSGSRTLLSAFLIAASTAELEARGLQFAGVGPDLVLNFLSRSGDDEAREDAAVLREQRRYGAWDGYDDRFGTQARIASGTIVVHVIDRTSNRLVWEAAATRRLTDQTGQALEASVDEVMREVFAEFPR